MCYELLSVCCIAALEVFTFIFTGFIICDGSIKALMVIEWCFIVVNNCAAGYLEKTFFIGKPSKK